MKQKPVLHSWKFGPICKKHPGTKITCSKCKQPIEAEYRRTSTGVYGSTYFYHLKCVAFIASRYANVNTKNLSSGEMGLKKWYDEQVGITPIDSMQAIV